MIYFKTSQPVPGKGEAWMYYECNDDTTIRRYLTYFPSTREIDKVPKPFIKKLQRPEMLMPSTEDEFYQFWPPDSDELAPSDSGGMDASSRTRGEGGHRYFDPDMTVGEAMSVHPQVAEVFAAFHLGGCANCGVSEYETVAQVCMAYGVDVELLIEVLDELMDQKEQSSESEKTQATVK